MKLSRISIEAGEQNSGLPYRMLHKPVSMYITARLNRSAIAAIGAPAAVVGGHTNYTKPWNRLCGFTRCGFWKALRTAIMQPDGMVQEAYSVELLWRYENDRVQLCIRYTINGSVAVVHVPTPIKFDTDINLKLRMPGYKKKHGWGYYLPPVLHQPAKNPMIAHLRCTIGHQAKDAYGDKL